MTLLLLLTALSLSLSVALWLVILYITVKFYREYRKNISSTDKTDLDSNESA